MLWLKILMDYFSKVRTKKEEKMGFYASGSMPSLIQSSAAFSQFGLLEASIYRSH